jgi:VWFA-related protein
VPNLFHECEDTATIEVMWLKIPAILILSGFFAAHIARPATQTPGATDFSVSVNLVKVPISVFDEKGSMVTQLWKEDFRIWEDQTAQEIRSSGVDENPVSVVLVLDTSMSETKSELKKIKEAAENFADALKPGDNISLLTFDDEVYRILDWTGNRNQVRRALSRVQSGWRTVLYDAIYLAAADQLKGVEGRKAIILLTDCVDNDSSVNFHDASLAIVQSQASFYVVSKTILMREAAEREPRVQFLSNVLKKLYGDENIDYVDEFFKKRESEMIDLSEKTGGRCFFPKDYDQIKHVYSDIAHELKSKYFLTYVSNQELAPNSFHRIAIEYLKPSSKIIHRKGYYFQPLQKLRPSNDARFAVPHY